jgi:RND family efflux transporter MFP subunit
MHKVIPFISILLFSTLLAAAPAAENKRPPKRVEVATAAAGPAQMEWRLYATLLPARASVVVSEVEGRIDRLAAEVGSRVKRGELLAQIDDRLLRGELARVVAQREQAAQDVNRLSRLDSTQVVAADELARSRTALRIAEADEANLRIRLAQAAVTAPFAAQVTARPVEMGSFVVRNTPLYHLADIEQLRIELPLPQSAWLALVSGATPAEFMIQPRQAAAVTARLVRRLPGFSHGQGVVELALPAQGLHSGEWVEVRMVASLPAAAVVPFAALQRDDSGDFVWRLEEDGKVRRLAVAEPWFVTAGVALPAGAIAAGDRVVVRGFTALRDGDSVTASGGKP